MRADPRLYAFVPTATLVNASSPIGNPTNVIATAFTGDYRIDTLLESLNQRFNDKSPLGTPVTVTYSFPTQLPASYSGEDTQSWKAFSAQQQSNVRSILGTLQTVVNITFQEVSDSPTSFGTMRFSNNAQVGDSAGYALLPNTENNDKDSDVWINLGQETGVTPGTAEWATLVHEIGHAIGLKHPGNYNGSELPDPTVTGNFLNAGEDAFFNTIMTYRDSAQGLQDEFFMPFDILTLRHLYGKNAVQTGDNVYRFTDATGLRVTNLVDDGGIDTLDFSALGVPVSVDLTPGAFSNVGKTPAGDSALANLTTAFDFLAEKVIGSPLADTLIGNAANNSLTGGNGNDSLDGAAGTDTAFFVGARASYQINASTQGSSQWVISAVGAADGIDTLTRIERLQFSDARLGLDTALGQSAGNAVLLLGAVLGNNLLQFKKPLIGVVADLFDTGLYAMPVLAGALMRLPIWGALTGTGTDTATNAQIAAYLLQTVNKAVPDANTLNAAIAALDSQTGSAQGGFLGQLAQSANNQLQVNLVGLAATGVDMGPPTV